MALSAATTARAQTARIELHIFDSVTLTDQQFLAGTKDGNAVQVAGELRLAPGTERAPAVVLIHQCSGIGANVERWAEVLNGIGVGVFLVDSFTSRGIVETCTDQTRLGNLGMIIDAYRALDLLAKHPRVDASRIAIMGFSKGAFAALYSSLKRFQRMYGTDGIEFAAYLPFYGRCETRYIDDEKVAAKPIRLFHGEDDDYIPIAPCRAYVERLRKKGVDILLTAYPNARHSFDNPLYPALRTLPDAEVSTRCRREERQNGVIFNLDTNRPYSQKDACVTRGASIGFNAEAQSAAVMAVTAFLTDTFHLSTSIPTIR